MILRRVQLALIQWIPDHLLMAAAPRGRAHVPASKLDPRMGSVARGAGRKAHHQYRRLVLSSQQRQQHQRAVQTSRAPLPEPQSAVNRAAEARRAFGVGRQLRSGGPSKAGDCLRQRCSTHCQAHSDERDHHAQRQPGTARSSERSVPCHRPALSTDSIVAGRSVSPRRRLSANNGRRAAKSVTSRKQRARSAGVGR